MSSTTFKEIPITLTVWICILATSSCYFEAKKPPVYVGTEEKVKVENREDDKEKAQKAAEDFHRLFNEGKYEEIFQLLDDKSQLKQDEVYFLMRMRKINTELGKFESTTFARANVFQKKSTYEVRMECVSKFEKEALKPERYEIFGWELYENGDIKLFNYLNSRDGEPSK